MEADCGAARQLTRLLPVTSATGAPRPPVRLSTDAWRKTHTPDAPSSTGSKSFAVAARQRTEQVVNPVANAPRAT